MDANGDGLLQREEFEADDIVRREQHLARHLQGMFDAADVDGSGTVSISELARVAFPRATAREMKDILMLVRWRPEAQAKVARLLHREYSPEVRRDLMALFRAYDKDGSGVITRRELVIGMKSMLEVFSVGEQLVMRDEDERELEHGGRSRGGNGRKDRDRGSSGWAGPVVVAGSVVLGGRSSAPHAGSRGAPQGIGIGAGAGPVHASGRHTRKVGLFSLVEADLELMLRAAREGDGEEGGESEGVPSL